MTDIFLSSSYEMENERQWWCRSGNPPEPEEIPPWFLKAAKEYGAKVVANLTPGKLYLGQSYTDFFLEFEGRKPRADCVEWYFEHRRGWGIDFSGVGILAAFEATEPKAENLKKKCERCDPHGWITKEFLRILEEQPNGKHETENLV